MKKMALTALLMTAYSFAASAETYTYKCEGIRNGEEYINELKINRTQGDFYPFTAEFKGEWTDEKTNTKIFNKQFTDLEGGLEGTKGDQYFSLTSKSRPDVIFYAQLRKEKKNVEIEGRQGLNARVRFSADNCVLTIDKKK